ncbi:MAG: aspartate-semialdehyde dehydrogenase [Actinobacteria bacterium]|nr:MAG: aspartate-semialdehyde dehydrogenase [Actinomycetota bacterium]
MSDRYNVAIVGATGAVGQEMRKVLEQRDFPVDNIKFLASRRSEGKRITFKRKGYNVEELKDSSFEGIDFALFSAGGSVSEQFAPIAAEQGTIVIDNSSAFRMDKDVPLVVPEVNPQAIKKHKNIIANPNCSTIQMVVALKPIHDKAKIKRVVVSTYQAVSGTGAKAVAELSQQTRAYSANVPLSNEVYPYQIAFNVLPHIDVFFDDGYTKEEVKMVKETQKILDRSIKVSATTVRVPVFIGHSESVNIETENKITAKEARELLSEAPGISVIDDPAELAYPMPIDCVGKDDVFVGRIREDSSVPKGLNLWVVSDNLRKGAALNAVQIAELLI